MSKKTIKQRIALVAASALTAGALSVVSMPVANAAVAAGDLAVSTTASATNYGVISVTGATDSVVEMLSTGQLALTGSGATLASTAGDYVKYAITQGSGVFTYITNASGGSDNITGELAASGQSATWTQSASLVDSGTAIYFKPTGLGKVVILYTKKVGSTVSTVETFTIYVVASAAASVSDSLSVGDSFCKLVDSSTNATAVATSVDTQTRPYTNGSVGYLGFSLRDGYSALLQSTGALVATSSSKDAVVAIDADPSSTSTTTAVKAGDGDGSGTGSEKGAYISIAQATANKPVTTTVTLTFNGTTVCSRTITILGELTTLKASSTAAEGLKIQGSGVTGVTTAVTDYMVLLLAYDAAGNRVASSAPTVDSGLSTTVTAFTSQALTSTASAGTSGTGAAWTCAASASGSTTLVVKTTNASGTSIKSNPFVARCGNIVAYSYTASLDKASYVPGDVATLTITAKDSKGNPVADTVTLGTGSGIAGSNMTAVTAPTDADKFTSGTKTYKFVVGSSEGSYQMSVSLPAYAAYGATDQTVAYAIKASTATVSNADVLKSIVSLIASINKQIQALQKLILRR